MQAKLSAIRKKLIFFKVVHLGLCPVYGKSAKFVPELKNFDPVSAKGIKKTEAIPPRSIRR
jgi:hypothetical protein